MKMEMFKNLVITEIEPPQIVHSEKGREFHMVDRPSYGLSLCIDGQITYTKNGKQFVSAKETAVILPKGGNYTLYGDRDGLFPLINFQCEGFTQKDILAIPLTNPQACIHTFEKLKQQAIDSTSHFQTFSLFYKLLEEITSKPQARNPLLTRAAQYIGQNLSSPALTNASIAAALDISEVYLRKLFISHLGTTPKQHILDLRIQKAKSLLTDTPLTVTAISESCGFSSIYHFSREFKKKNGITPSQYAESHKIFKM